MIRKTNRPTAHRFEAANGARRRASLSAHLYTPAALLALAVLLALCSLPACQGRDPVEQQKNRLLTPDERYLVELYMKITEIEENLQDNPEELEEKRKELREQIDLERIRRVLLELEKDPERWLTVYNRIFELQQRRDQKSPN